MIPLFSAMEMASVTLMDSLALATHMCSTLPQTAVLASFQLGISRKGVLHVFPTTTVTLPAIVCAI